MAGRLEANPSGKQYPTQQRSARSPINRSAPEAATRLVAAIAEGLPGELVSNAAVAHGGGFERRNDRIRDGRLQSACQIAYHHRQGWNHMRCLREGQYRVP